MVVLSASATEINVGDTVTFTVTDGLYKKGITIKINNNEVYYNEDSSSFTYTHTFDSDGTFSVFAQDMNGQSNEIIITVTESLIAESWTIGNKTVESLYIGNKEIETIKRVSDGAIIYQKITHNYALTVSLSTNSIYDDESTVISGVLTDNGSVVSGKTITIYNGNTSLGTCTTNSNGVYSKTLSGFNVGSHTLKASYTDVDSSTVSLNVQSSAIVLTAPDLTLTYKDGTQTQITVMKKGQPYGVGENVVLTINGSNYNVAIDSDGYANRNVNLSVGTYTATVTYGSVSTTCTYVITKASSTITMNVSNTSIFTTDTLTVSGQVTSPSIGNASVRIYDGSTLIETVTSLNGAYSTTLTGLSIGTHTLRASYMGDSNHDSSKSSTKTVTVSTSDNLSITSTKDILSYRHSDSATITAILTDSENSPLTNKTLSYAIKHGTTTISSGTKTTNSSGKATITYASTGVGDVNIDVSYGSLTETYTIEDCNYWNSNEVTVTNTITSTLYDSNMSEALSTNCEISFDVLINNVASSDSASMIRLIRTSDSDTSTRYSVGIRWRYSNSIFSASLATASNTSSEVINSMSEVSQNTYYNYKLTKEGTSVERFIDGTSYGTRTISWINNSYNYCFRIKLAKKAHTIKMKNVKIKAL